MSEYLPAFLVDPVLRQARRLSRISGSGAGACAGADAGTGPDDSAGFLPPVPDFQRWTPSRLWNTNAISSPVDEGEEGQEGHGTDGDGDEIKESRVRSIARIIQLWTNQLNNLDLDDNVAEDDCSILADRVVLERPMLEEAFGHRNDHAHSHSHSHSDSDSNSIHSNSDSLSDDGNVHSSIDRAYTRRKSFSEGLPEDDGMRVLRQRIHAIWSGPGTSTEKSRRIHALMMQRYRNAQRRLAKDRPKPGSTSADVGQRSLSPASQDVVFNLTQADLTPTYAPPCLLDAENAQEQGEEVEPEPELGCVHYQRKVKMQCATCERWYTCRFCHDEVEDHTLPRRETKYMLCMLCQTPQEVGQTCRMCNEQAAYYYCGICKLWNDDSQKKIYHCDDCGICRLGEGLGKDFFHCQRCAACMSISAEATHRCIERSTKCDCPICGEYMFTSNKAVAFMRCGHSIHESCFSDWCKTSYKCPICSKSIANMESQFRRLDRHIAEQPMPEEYSGSRAYVFCNDCNSRTVTPYHWLGLKCTLCESYNTAQLDLLGPHDRQPEESGAGEAAMTASQAPTAPTEELIRPAALRLEGQRSEIETTAAAMPISPSRQATGSPWRMMMPSPTIRSIRSMSPVVGSYFGTRQTPSQTPAVPPPPPLVDKRHTDTGIVTRTHAHTAQDDDDDDNEEEEEEDDNLGFWGRLSPIGHRNRRESESSDEEEDDDDEDEEEEEDDDDLDDKIDIFGHR